MVGEGSALACAYPSDGSSLGKPKFRDFPEVGANATSGSKKWGLL